MGLPSLSGAVAQIRQDLREARARVDDLERLEALAVKVYGDPGGAYEVNVTMGREDEPVTSTSASPAPPPAGPLTGLASIDAARQVLQQAGTAMKTMEVFAAMQDGGWHTTSKNPKNLMTTALTRLVARDERVTRPAVGLYTYSEPVAAEDNDSENADDPAEAGPSTGVRTANWKED